MVKFSVYLTAFLLCGCVHQNIEDVPDFTIRQIIDISNSRYAENDRAEAEMPDNIGAFPPSALPEGLVTVTGQLTLGDEDGSYAVLDDDSHSTIRSIIGRQLVVEFSDSRRNRIFLQRFRHRGVLFHARLMGVLVNGSDPCGYLGTAGQSPNHYRSWDYIDNPDDCIGPLKEAEIIEYEVIWDDGGD